MALALYILLACALCLVALELGKAHAAALASQTRRKRRESASAGAHHLAASSKEFLAAAATPSDSAAKSDLSIPAGGALASPVSSCAAEMSAIKCPPASRFMRETASFKALSEAAKQHRQSICLRKIAHQAKCPPAVRRQAARRRQSHEEAAELLTSLLRSPYPLQTAAGKDGGSCRGALCETRSMELGAQSPVAPAMARLGRHKERGHVLNRTASMELLVL